MQGQPRTVEDEDAQHRQQQVQRFLGADDHVPGHHEDEDLDDAVGVGKDEHLDELDADDDVEQILQKHEEHGGVGAGGQKLGRAGDVVDDGIDQADADEHGHQQLQRFGQALDDIAGDGFDFFHKKLLFGEKYRY